jgi:hypothetical protein
VKVTDEAIINALLSCKTNTQAADICGLSREQLCRRIKSPEFREKLKTARAYILEGATSALQAATSSAVDTMVSIMRDEENPPQVRLNASESIIRNCLRMTEQCEILQRLDELEARVNDA